MPDYIKKCLHKFSCSNPKQQQHSPHSAPPPMFGLKLHELSPADMSDPLDEPGKKCLQQIVGSILFCASAVDNTALKVLNTIA